MISLTHFVNGPTREGEYLVFVFSKHHYRVNKIETVEPAGASDHNMISLEK